MLLMVLRGKREVHGVSLTVSGETPENIRTQSSTVISLKPAT